MDSFLTELWDKILGLPVPEVMVVQHRCASWYCSTIQMCSDFGEIRGVNVAYVLNTSEFHQNILPMSVCVVWLCAA